MKNSILEINLNDFFSPNAENALGNEDVIQQDVNHVVNENVLESIQHVDIDQILLEWSYRSEKGYPDLNSTKDLIILKEILNEMDIKMPIKSEEEITEAKPVEVDTDHQLSISAHDLANLILNGKYSDKILKRIAVLLSRTDETVESIEKSLEGILGSDAQRADEIIDIVLDGKTDQVQFAAYLNNRTITANSFSSPASMQSVFKQTGLSPTAIETLSMYRWPSTPTIGGAEVLLAVLLKGGARPAAGQPGDLIVENQVYEVKGRNARLKAQNGYGSPKAARDGWKLGYERISKQHQNVSLSGGAKTTEGFLDIQLPSAATEYGSDQSRGWITVLEEANRQYIESLQDIESLEVLKQDLAIAIGTGFAAVYDNLSVSDFAWVAGMIDDSGKFARKEFYKQFAIESFEYYINSVTEKPLMFVITNMTSGTKKPKLENANILIFPSNKEGFAKHVLTDIGIALPSFSDSAGVLGTTIGLNLGTVNKF